mmetsp:Transcript_15671/g.27226  ORF Transcript_15671/g.27226 Transcript_15671/m.27226 type:complete len:677 (+) Transcript_15671:229-2259(+)
MVEMNSFSLPPAIRRFGRCGGEEVQDVRSEETGPSSYAPGAGADRMKSFVNGIVSPFAACWQPSLTSCVSGGASCVPGCGAPDYSSAFRKKPAVVSPLAERQVPPPYRDSRATPPMEDESSVVASSTNNFQAPPSSRNAAEDRSSKTSRAATEIQKPHSNDVLCGRGGSSNRHQGNIHFRELVAANKKIYVGLTKKQKMMVARKIVDAVHSTNPPGRFLAKDLDTGLFYDIGLPRSLEKTSQALREKNSNEMTAQTEGEGIEASVESYQSVAKDTSSQREDTCSPQVPGESPEGSTKSSKSAKNVEAPPLVIPPHLMSVFGPKKERREGDWNEHTMSPNGPRYMDPRYGSHPGNYPPYHPPYGSMPGGPPPPPYRNGYHMSHQPPRHPVGHHPHAPRHYYPPSPPPSHPGYTEHAHYYYPQQRTPHTPPYARYHHPEEQDKRESYNESYSRSAERDSPNRTDVRGRPPPPHYPHGYPPYPMVPGSSAHHRRPVGPPPPPPRAGHAPSSPATQGRPYYGYHKMPPPDGTSPVIYRTPSNGYVRGTSEVSPERQREVKRQRNADGHIRRVSESSLSSAVRNSLSLEEKPGVRERRDHTMTATTSAAGASGSNSTTSANTNASASDLMSPSSILQSRSRRSMDGKESSCSSETKEDYSALSGLAALSTAAFLKLDEDKS